jgi:hypothetical protein
MGGPSTFSQEAKERFPWPAWSQAIHRVHIVCLELQLDRLSDESVHAAGFGREDLGVLESGKAFMVEPMFRHRRLVLMSKPYVPVMLFNSDLDRSTSLSDVHLAALTRNAIHAWSPTTILLVVVVVYL